MPFGLVWFGQVDKAQKTSDSAWESPMPFGLVWFGQTATPLCDRWFESLVSNAFRLGLVWSENHVPHLHQRPSVSNAFRLGLVWSGHPHEHTIHRRRQSPMPFGLVWFGQPQRTRSSHSTIQVSNAFRLGLVWSGTRAARNHHHQSKSPMPFGLVWFGQAIMRADAALAFRVSPMPFGLVWFGQQRTSPSTTDLTL